MAYQSFEELVVWKRACLLAVCVYEQLKDNRDFALRDQMQRASVSIASNIAEGSERGGKDFARFLRIAQGSSAELRTQVYIAAKIGLIPSSKCTEIVDELKQLSKMLTALRQSVQCSVSSVQKTNPKPSAVDRQPKSTPENRTLNTEN